MSAVELFFLVSLFLPPTVVVLGGVLLLSPSRRTSAAGIQAHAH